MVVGEIATRHQVVVVGAGPGGYTAALAAAKAGLDTAVVEREHIGGVCLNTGCIPSKALLSAADLADRARNAASFGIHTNVTIELSATRAATTAVIAQLTTGVTGLLDAARVIRYGGTARLIGSHRLVIDQGPHVQYVEFDHVILATGSRPVTLPGFPVDGLRVHDSTTALAMTEIPRRVAVLGGGYIGVELGTALAKLGARVTLVEATAGLLAGFPRSAANAVSRRLGQLGINVRVYTSATGYEEGRLTVADETGATSFIGVDAVVVAVGRRPNSDGLGLERVGVTPRSDGRLDVDGARRTAARHVLAIGDLTDGPALAHKATAEAEVAAATAAGRRASFDAQVPMVVFSDPEIASVGLTSELARARDDDDVSSVRVPLRSNARLLTSLGTPTDGFAELVFDRRTRTVLGGLLCGPHAGELITEVTLAVEAGLSIDDMSLTVHPHPTVAEAWREAASRAP